jgi:hypothetical protein
MTELSGEQRETLGQLADGLIPAAGKMPSATQAGVEGKWVDRALAIRPDLSAPLREVLTAAARSADATEGLQRLERDDPAGLALLKQVVAGAYYMAPPVRKRMGYRGQPRTPIREGEAERYLGEELLAPVRARGRCYRPAD